MDLILVAHPDLSSRVADEAGQDADVRCGTDVLSKQEASRYEMKVLVQD